MRTYPKAAEGLKLLFIAEILTIVAAVLSLIPFVGAILAIVALVLNLLALNKASGDDQGYRTAFIVAIVNLVVSFVSLFTSGALLTILDVVSTVLTLAMVFYVVNTTGNLAHSLGNDELSRKGKTVWTLYLVCTVVSVVISLLSLIPVLGTILGGLLAVVLLVVQLIAFILYMLFLNRAGKELA